ncbi:MULTISPECIES: hypothetical protein [unclassified Streptomyces]|uniref:hypothetical protein n=1 Tax=unclassified Streptomyces TaxID=2593676 RepID=UPI002E2EAF76|nr:hypothetical protein [Streptomyces sp. NBC_01361]
MTPPTATIAPPREPVMLTISTRPPAHATATPPLPLTATPIRADEFQIIADLDVAADGAKCSCSAGDDQPY